MEWRCVVCKWRACPSALPLCFCFRNPNQLSHELRRAVCGCCARSSVLVTPKKEKRKSNALTAAGRSSADHHHRRSPEVTREVAGIEMGAMHSAESARPASAAAAKQVGRSRPPPPPRPRAQGAAPPRMPCAAPALDPVWTAPTSAPPPTRTAKGDSPVLHAVFILLFYIPAA